MISCHIPDFAAVADAPTSITLRAIRGKAVVWFLPFRRSEGVIEIPDAHHPPSVEAIIVDDNTGYDLQAGTKVAVSRSCEGNYFEVCGHRFCTVEKEGLLFIDTHASPAYAA